MSEPWEDFAGGATSVATTSNQPSAAAGDTLPWEDFQKSTSQGGVRLSSATPRLDRAADLFNKAMAYSPLALQESTNEPPTLATALGIPAGPARGVAAFPQEILKQGNLQNVAMLAMLPEAVLSKLPPLVKAAVASYFAKTAAEQAGTAAGHISVEGLPKLPVSPMSIDVPIGQALMGQPQAAQSFGGTTEQWRNLGEVANALLGGAGALGVTRGVGPRSSGLEPIDIESSRTFADMANQPVTIQDPSRVSTRTSQQDVPIVGQRPMTIEQPVLKPWEEFQAAGPIQPAAEISGVRPEVQGGQLPTSGQEFVSRADVPGFLQTAEQRLAARTEMEPTRPLPEVEPGKPLSDIETKLSERLAQRDLQGAISLLQDQPAQVSANIINKVVGVRKRVPISAGERMIFNEIWDKAVQQKTSQPMPNPILRMFSGLGISPEDLRPAIRWAGRLFVGEKGDSHEDIRERYGLPKELDHFHPGRGFAIEGATKPEDFLDRKQAEAATGIKGDAAAGGLDSQQLPGAAMHRLERMMREHDTQGQRRIQGSQREGQEPGRAVQEQGKGGAEATTGGIFQAPQEGRLTNQQARERAGRGETQYFSGLGGGLEDIQDVFTPKARLLLRSPEQLKLKTEGQVDAGQLVNRLLNTVPGGEKETLEVAGIKEAFKPGQKATVGEVDKWVKENGPKVEVRKLTATENVKQHQQRLAGLEHKLDMMDPNWRHLGVDQIINKSDEFQDAWNQWDNLREGIQTTPLTESATARYTMVNPKPLDQMPGAVDLLVRVPVEQRRRTLEQIRKGPPPRLSERGESSRMEGDVQISEHPKYTSSHYPTEGRNLLAHVRGYMETDAQGRKIFHVFEVQSDWAQEVRDKGPTAPLEPWQQAESGRWRQVGSDPLLRHYERLALKAAIEHARSQGADAIAISDAETAMMTEGHDRAINRVMTYPATEDNVRLARTVVADRAFWENNVSADEAGMIRMLAKGEDGVSDRNKISNTLQQKIRTKFGSLFEERYREDRPTQESGMRLHYDRTLPKIAEELTGEKGERVEFGEHQNALTKEVQREPDNIARLTDQTVSVPRKDLIFHNPDGTPKTTITARQYSLKKTGPPPYSTSSSRLYSGLPIPEGLSDAVDTAAEGMRRKLGFFNDLIYKIQQEGKPQDQERLKELKEIRDQLAGNEGGRLYSGVPFPTSIKDVQELTKKTFNHVFGMGVDRDLSEGVRNLAAKTSGWSVPRHAAANEAVANKMVEYAAADISAPLLAKAYGTDEALYKRSAVKSWIDEGVAAGLYQVAKKGDTAPMMKGKKAERITLDVKGAPHALWVRADLAPEVQMALTGAGKHPKSGMQFLMNLATEAQIIGPTDFVFHMGNMYSSIVGSLGAKTELGEVGRRITGAKQLDAAGRIGYHLYRTILDTPEVQKELADIAKIGALRSGQEHPSLMAKATGGVIDTGKWIRMIDRAGRLARNQMFDNLVDRGLVKDTPLDRREFINRMGQYNEKLMSHFQATMRQYLSQFVVAGRTFNRNALQRVLMSPEARATSPAAYAKMKAYNMIGVFSTLVAIPVAANLMLNGKPFGRDGTPVGKIDTGKDDKDGRHITIDPGQTELIRRGLRLSGGQALFKGIQEGQDVGKVVKSMAGDIIRGQIMPWEGPPVRMGLKGHETYAKTHDMGEAIKDAMLAANPTVQSFFSPQQEGEGGVKGVALQLGGAVGVGKSSFPTHQQKIKEVAEKAGLDLSDFDQRLAGEAYLKESRPPMSEEDRVKSAQTAIKNMAERRQVVMNSLSKEDKQWLKTNKIEPPGFGDYLEKGKVRVPYNDNENKFATEMYKSEYETVISFLRNDAGFKQLSGNEQQLVANEAFRDAAKRAREQTEEVVKSGALVEKPKKKKRFSAFAPE